MVTAQLEHGRAAGLTRWRRTTHYLFLVIFAYFQANQKSRLNPQAPAMNVDSIQKSLREFADERDWNRFHSPKNIATALAVEAGELLENFQWLTEAESRRLQERPEDYRAVREEIADVQIYLLRLADLLGIGLEEAVQDKLARNAEKYPVALAKGSALKYNRLGK
jgi:NTP pyrophosphatase (non-canonical NTP hydrolase)